MKIFRVVVKLPIGRWGTMQDYLVSESEMHKIRAYKEANPNLIINIHPAEKVLKSVADVIETIEEHYGVGNAV